MSEPVKPWVRSIKYHTYWNIPREPDTFYQVDNEQDAETIVGLMLGVREDPPARATRPPAPPSPDQSPTPMPPIRPRGRSANAMTTADLPKAKTDTE